MDWLAAVGAGPVGATCAAARAPVADLRARGASRRASVLAFRAGSNFGPHDVLTWWLEVE
jgi:hypothetical protein